MTSSTSRPSVAARHASSWYGLYDANPNFSRRSDTSASGPTGARGAAREAATRSDAERTGSRGAIGGAARGAIDGAARGAIDGAARGAIDGAAREAGLDAR